MHGISKKHEITIVDTYIDRAISGTTDNRQQFQKMIQDSDKNLFEAVIVWKTDRFARDRYNSAIYKARLKRNSVRVLYSKENIPDGPEGSILESLLEGMAEYYSAELSQKIKRGIRESALKCQSLGGYGACFNKNSLMKKTNLKAQFCKQSPNAQMPILRDFVRVRI